MIRSAIIAVLVAFFCGCSPDRNRSAAVASQAWDSITRAQVNAYIDTIWNRKDTAYLKNVVSPTISRTLNGIEVADTQRELQAHLNVFFTAFPDLRLTLEQTFVQRGHAFLLWHTEGTNTGTFGEVGPTGKKVKINGMSELYFDQTGRLCREIVYYNELDLLQQLGYALSPPVLQ